MRKSERDPFFNGRYTDILKLKCWVINLLQFSQMKIYWFNIRSKGPSMIADIPPLKFEVSGITRLLRNTNAKKACGPDNISLTGFWKKLRLSLPHFSSTFLHYQYKTCQVPSVWVIANITPVFKKRNREEPSNYRPISLTSVSCKMEWNILYTGTSWITLIQIILWYIINTASDNSTPYEMQLITIIESVAGNLDLGQ